MTEDQLSRDYWRMRALQAEARVDHLTKALEGYTKPIACMHCGKEIDDTALARAVLRDSASKD